MLSGARQKFRRPLQRPWGAGAKPLLSPRRAVLPDGKIAVRHPAPTEEDSRLPNVW